MVMRKYCFLILCFFVSNANAKCSISPVRWEWTSATQNLSRSSNISGNTCTHSHTPGGGSFTDSEIVKKPSHGKFEILNLYTFKYTANQNFNGQDNYSYKICGERYSKGCVVFNVQVNVTDNGNGSEIVKDSSNQKQQKDEKPNIEQKKISETEKTKINEVIKQKEQSELFAKTQRDAVASRVASLEAEKQKQIEANIERLARIEFEKKRIKEDQETKARADALRLAAVEAENKRQKEEAESKAKAQRLIELENEIKRLKGESVLSKPFAQSRQDAARNDIDPLSAFEGTWVSVNPPVFYLIFNKVALGIRQVSLPNIGQGNIRLSDGAHGSNFQISAANLNCYYFVTFTNNRQKMVMELKAGESLCLQSSVLEKAE